MKYQIHATYCWYEKKTRIVLMYFISGVPFTYDELPDECLFDEEIIKIANSEFEWELEDLYRTSFYLIDEQAHPMLFELDLENPEMLPTD
jgi:hypothetical protein